MTVDAGPVYAGGARGGGHGCWLQAPPVHGGRVLGLEVLIGFEVLGDALAQVVKGFPRREVALGALRGKL